MNPAYLLQRLAWWFYGRLPVIGNRGGALLQYVARSGVTVFVGPNGSGKSLLCVEATLPTLEGIPWSCSDLDHMHNREVRRHVDKCPDGCSAVVGSERFCGEGQALLEVHGNGVRLVWSTLPLLDDETGHLHPLYRPLTSLRSLPHIEHADVIFDEVSGVSDADSSASMSGALKRWLQQLRKRDVFLRVTTPAYDRCSLPIRQIATAVVDARSFYPEPVKNSRLWRPRRAMLFNAYNGFDFRSFDKNSGQTQKPEATLYYWRDAGRAMHSYNTLAQVHALSDVEESGSCIVCNGSRSRPKCGCAPDVYDINPDDLVIVEEEGSRGGRTRKAVPVWEADAEATGPRRGVATAADSQPGAAVEVGLAGAHRAEPHDSPTVVLAAAARS